MTGEAEAEAPEQRGGEEEESGGGGIDIHPEEPADGILERGGEAIPAEDFPIENDGDGGEPGGDLPAGGDDGEICGGIVRRGFG